jgi:heme/copper-type cytochrome/quinol oxidase subunit 3
MFMTDSIHSQDETPPKKEKRLRKEDYEKMIRVSHPDPEVQARLKRVMAEIKLQALFEETKLSLAGKVVLIILFMLFATLFLIYAIYRLKAPSWPPDGMYYFPLTLPVIASIGLIICELFRALAIVERDNYKHFVWANIGSFSGLLVYILSNFKLWSEMKKFGLWVDAGIFPSIIFLMTSIHLLHCLALPAIQIYLVWQARDPDVGADLNILKLHTHLTHFLTMIWFFIFIFIFIL